VFFYYHHFLLLLLLLSLTSLFILQPRHIILVKLGNSYNPKIGVSRISNFECCIKPLFPRDACRICCEDKARDEGLGGGGRWLFNGGGGGGGGGGVVGGGGYFFVGEGKKGGKCVPGP